MTRHEDLRRRIIDLLGGKCVHCGTSEYHVLQINHVHNDGHLLVRGGRVRGLSSKHFYAILRGDDDLSRYELLCANCHQLRTKGII